jgi:hypothetical protein
VEDRGTDFVGLVGVCTPERKQDQSQSVQVTTLKKSEGRVIGHRRVVRVKEETTQDDIHFTIASQQRQLPSGGCPVLP